MKNKAQTWIQIISHSKSCGEPDWMCNVHYYAHTLTHSHSHASPRSVQIHRPFSNVRIIAFSRYSLKLSCFACKSANPRSSRVDLRLIWIRSSDGKYIVQNGLKMLHPSNPFVAIQSEGKKSSGAMATNFFQTTNNDTKSGNHT